jgi:hypothetical protein
MPRKSYAKLTESWRALIAATAEHEALLGDVAEQRQALARHLEKLDKLKALQVSATATRQRCTQEINEGVEEGELLAIGLRGAVASKLGPRNELLVQFGKAPLRKRGRRARPAEGDAAAPTVTAGPAEAPRLPETSSTAVSGQGAAARQD